jgi:uncharacterized protein (TIGR02646 family)
VNARAHFGDPAKQGEPFPFAAYKLAPVKAALNDTFHFKCAYCESSFEATQPLDVEHFRPKSGVLVDTELVWGVYFWLAAKWGNLLPSCSDCNRPRKQTLPDGTEQTLGKANQFPIASEGKRAAKEGDEKKEGRLLVHPCLDDPSKHFVFEPDGIISWKTSKGRESIRVYALLRRGLVNRRKEMQLEIRTHVSIARGLARKLETDGPDADLEALLAEELTALARFIDPTHVYSAMAHALIDPVLEELMG